MTDPEPATPNPIPRSVNLRGTRYTVQESEGLIVFSEGPGVWGCKTRIAFQRRCGCWQVSIAGTSEWANVGHISRAHEYVVRAYGDNFQQQRGEHEP